LSWNEWCIMKLRYRKIRRFISFKWLILTYLAQGATWEEADWIAKSVTYGWNWGKDDE